MGKVASQGMLVSARQSYLYLQETVQESSVEEIDRLKHIYVYIYLLLKKKMLHKHEGNEPFLLSLTVSSPVSSLSLSERQMIGCDALCHLYTVHSCDWTRCSNSLNLTTVQPAADSSSDQTAAVSASA